MIKHNNNNFNYKKPWLTTVNEIKCKNFFFFNHYSGMFLLLKYVYLHENVIFIIEILIFLNVR